MSIIRLERVSNGFTITEISSGGTSVRLLQFSEKASYQAKDKSAALDLTKAVVDFFCLCPDYYDFEIQIKAVKKRG